MASTNQKNNFQAGQFYPPEGLKYPVRNYIIECLPAAIKGEKFIARPGGIAFNQSQFWPFNKLVYYLEKWCYSKAEWIVMGSSEELKNFAMRFPELSENPRLIVIPTGVPEQKFTNGLGLKVVLWAGRNKKVKRPELVLDVARLLPDYKFIMITWGKPLTTTLPNVIILDNASKESVLANYRDCDVFLNTSESEGTPRAVLEAASFGKPVVTTPIGRFFESQLQTFSDPFHLAFVIQTAYESRLKLGKEAWQFVRNNHSIASNKKGWKNFSAKKNG